MTMEAGIRNVILSQSTTAGLADTLTEDTPLFESQALDSLGIFELIVHLEQKYGIQILDEEAVPENFGTVATIARFVEGKLAAQSA